MKFGAVLSMVYQGHFIGISLTTLVCGRWQKERNGEDCLGIERQKKAAKLQGMER